MKKWIYGGAALLVVLVSALVLLADSEQPGTPGDSPSVGGARQGNRGDATSDGLAGFAGQPGSPAPGNTDGSGGLAGPALGYPLGGHGGMGASTAATPGQGSAVVPAESPAPWMSNRQPPAGAAANPRDAEKQKRLAELQAMQADLLRQIQEGKQPDTRQVDATLARLQELEGSPIVAGVNIPAVRHNLEKAHQLQQLAQEMEREAKKPGGPDMNRLNAQMAQLQRLQSQLRTDVSVNQPGTPAPVLPQAPGMPGQNK